MKYRLNITCKNYEPKFYVIYTNQNGLTRLGLNGAHALKQTS